MHSLDRRRFLQSASAAALAGFAGKAAAVEPFQRVNPRIKGLALTSYSLRQHMHWQWGKEKEGEQTMLGFLDYCAELGLEGVELTSYFFERPVKPARLNAIRRRAHLLGLDVAAAAMGNNFGHPPGSDEGKQNLAYFREWIDHFSDLGAPVARVFASKSTPKGASDDEVLANVVANLEVALPYAEKRGVMLGLENHDFVKNVDYLLRVLKAVDSDWLGVTWDSANLDPTPDPYGELARIAPYAVNAQVKVTTRVNGKHVQADYARLVKILRDADYAGYLVLEYEEKEEPYEAVPRFVADVRKALKSTS